MEIKEDLLQFCREHLSKKKEVLTNRGASLQESLDSETKSSAGDKYETGRAMVQLEQEKLGKQLLELTHMTKVLKQVELGGKTQKASLGSLVRTTGQDYFISISSGMFKSKNGKTIFCISPGSPIAQLLLGKEVGDTFSFQGKVYEILELN